MRAFNEWQSEAYSVNVAEAQSYFLKVIDMDVPRFSVVPETDNGGFIDLLRNSSVGKTALKEQTAKLLEQRTSLVKRTEQLNAEASKSLPRHQDAVSEALKQFQEAEREVRRIGFGPGRGRAAGAVAIAREKLDEARNICTAASQAYTAEHDRLESALRATSSMEIKLFVKDMWDELAKATRTPIIPTSKYHQGAITRPSLVRRLKAIRDVIHEAEKLQLTPDQSDISMRLQQLRMSLPSLEK
jgi:hypothetical protein